MTKKIWETIGGRKFLGFLLATLLVYAGKISDQVWLVAFITYCGANVAQKIGLNIKEVKKQ